MNIKSNVLTLSDSKKGLFHRHASHSQTNNNKGRLTNMDIKLLPLSTTRAKLLTVVALSGAWLASPASAEEFLCDAKQTSTQELPLLSSSCPIGKGLWGKQQPKGEKSTFWIQCGVLAKPLSVDEAKSIYQHISTDVWAKIEGKNARCLIGPYQDFAQASKDLKAVKSLKPYKQAFIREVVEGVTKTSGSVIDKPIKTNTRTAAAAKVTSERQSTTIIPPVKPAKVAAKKNTPVVESSEPESLEISIRREVKVGNVHYKVPYLPFSDAQFYMEYDKPWNRLNFETATKVCQQLNMRLPNKQQWQALLEAKVMKSNQWPMFLPYWGAENTALFTSGKITTTSGKSLLNVMCVG
ncbi:SPOR domain-containing protein [Vibrio kasasachensis]|uniref:SPOR domain-containing protein n=1 Tax=Vibrio kasasachensis TaxID=2910248 RepID=UPI003D0F259E